MIYWAIEYAVGRGRWHIDTRTLRQLRRDAIQAPLEIDPSLEFYDRYHQRRCEGTARPVKVRIVRCP
jgi:hypothetical protein